MAEDSVKLDIPFAMGVKLEQAPTIQWCDGHWAEYMFALKDRGLEDQIAGDAEELNAKFISGDMDPCWEGMNMINLGALECFGPDKILDENAGCPVCAFANIIRHVGDLMATKYGSTH